MAKRTNNTASAIDRAGADVAALVKSFVEQVRYIAKKGEARQALWNKLAPIQFDGVKPVNGLEITEGPLLSAGVNLAASFPDKGQKNEAMNAFRVELNRSFMAFFKYEKGDAPFSVGLKLASKGKGDRLVIKAKRGQSVDEALAGLIKVYGVDDLAKAITRHETLALKVAEQIADLIAKAK